MAFHLLSVSGLITDTVSNGHMQDTMGKPASGMSVFFSPSRNDLHCIGAIAVCAQTTDRKYA